MGVIYLIKSYHCAHSLPFLPHVDLPSVLRLISSCTTLNLPVVTLLKGFLLLSAAFNSPFIHHSEKS